MITLVLLFLCAADDFVFQKLELFPLQRNGYVTKKDRPAKSTKFVVRNRCKWVGVVCATISLCQIQNAEYVMVAMLGG